MPERFKVTRAEEPERETAHGKLLPTYAEVEQKGTYAIIIIRLFIFRSHRTGSSVPLRLEHED